MECFNWIHGLITGLSANQPDASLSVYPNPASSEVWFRIPKSISTRGRISLFDYSGKMFFAWDVNEQETRIDLQGLAAGIYFWQYSGKGGEVISGKLMVD